jgi:hypothetical protein
VEEKSGAVMLMRFAELDRTKSLASRDIFVQCEIFDIKPR